MDKESLKGCASVVLGTLVTMLIVFTGLVGSVFSPEIKTSIASWTPTWLEVVPAFWILVGLSALAFFIHSFVTERRVVDAQSQLQSQIVTLGDSIKLFRSREYAAALEKLQDKWISEKSKFPKLDVGELRATIRLYLWSVLELLTDLNTEQVSASLSASLMQFYKQASPELQRRMDYFQKNLMFAEPEVSVSLLRGILLVRADLSTTNAPYTDVPGPDDRLEEKALPILAPENERTDDGKLRVLIGAPLVMCDENTFYYLGDTKRIKEETRDYNYFQTDKVTKIERYFTEKKIGSFVSLPLQDSSGEKIGVLNFDSSLPNMIPEDLVENFTSTSHVITGILSELFLLLLQKEQALPGAELPRMEEPVAVELPQVEEPVKSREKTGGPEVTKGMAQSQDSEKVTKKRRKRRRRQKKDR